MSLQICPKNKFEKQFINIMTELENSNHSENTHKERHGCVTIWFILLIIVNTCVCAVYVFATDEIAKLIPIKLPTNLFYVLSIFSCMNVVFVILLIKWKRHGFYGIAINALASTAINIKMGMDITSAMAGLIGIGILYSILQIKKNEASTWEQLK